MLGFTNLRSVGGLTNDIRQIDELRVHCFCGDSGAWSFIPMVGQLIKNNKITHQ